MKCQQLQFLHRDRAKIFTIVGNCLLVLILINIALLRRMSTTVRLHGRREFNLIENGKFSSLLAKLHE